jgi:hypothetical protein
MALVVEEIWDAADKCFGRPEVFKAWPMVCKKWEHALWHWNDQFGPLNQKQRDYFVEVVISCLVWAGTQQEVQRRYASYQASLMAKLNHERVRDGFQMRGSAPDPVMLTDFQMPKEIPA